jgi:hypothetical protein
MFLSGKNIPITALNYTPSEFSFFQLHVEEALTESLIKGFSHLSKLSKLDLSYCNLGPDGLL